MRKTFILDTNVLLHDVRAMFSFSDNLVVIPISVIEELDHFKTHSDERGKSARMISRQLDELRKNGKLNKGVKLDNGGTLRIELDHEHVLPPEFHLSAADNRILNSAFGRKKKGETTIIVSKDINMRLKAEAVGLDAQDYETGKVNVDELYSGMAEVDADPSDVDAFYKNKSLTLKGEYFPNQFIVLKAKANAKKSALGKVVSSDGKTASIVPLSQNDPAPWGIKPLNKEQRFAMELMMDESIQLVTLVGVAGTGKTLVSLAAGLQKAVEENVYRRLIVCRSIVPVGRDIGFLPGSKEEKLNVWMGAIYDNLEFLCDRKHPDEGTQQIDYMMQSGKVEIASVTHIRGRTLPKQYMIVDDAQNLTPHEIKTILSRAGEGTKVVVTGDPYQIDSPYLDVESNGLTFAVDKFKGQKIHGHITFTKTERSPLAALVAELM
ncbi:MAG: PhoH family protein [Elusimicrobia bacterium]|nr:PhoH family protein [Elusimicrobiota bacterium]